MGQQPPTSYVKVENRNFNHDNYVRNISLDPPYGTPQPPHYICFDLDFSTHQHYVCGLHDNSVPPLQSYDWTLEAAPVIGPRIPHAEADNEKLGIFNTDYLVSWTATYKTLTQQ
jgi:hypothetical protein